MRTQLLAAAAVLILQTIGSASARSSYFQNPPTTAPPAGGHPASSPGAVAPRLLGLWASAPNKTPLSGAFEESVWGPNAVSVRTVELDIRSSGQAVLKVTSKVVDARGRVVRGSTAVEEARLQIGAAGEPSPAGTPHEVSVLNAERRYPDDPASQFPLDGLKVRLLTRDNNTSLEIRYDTPEGRGSFWETLVPEAKKGTVS